MNQQRVLDNSPIDLYSADGPIRLAVVAADGFPHIVSLWFKYKEGQFYCATHKSAWIVRQLRLNNQVGFEISTNKPPYKGIRGSAVITLKPMADDLLEQLITAYLNNTDSSLASWLTSRKKDEIVIQVSPKNVTSWDYSERMEAV